MRKRLRRLDLFKGLVRGHEILQSFCEYIIIKNKNTENWERQKVLYSGNLKVNNSVDHVDGLPHNKNRGDTGEYLDNINDDYD